MYQGGHAVEGEFSSRRSAPGRSSRNPELDNLFFFFFDIDKNWPSPSEFASRWQELNAHNFNAKQISIILLKTGEYYKMLDNPNDPYGEPDAAKQIKQAVLQDWHLWENAALKEMHQFKPINLSFAIKGHQLLGILPSQKFMQAWTDRANRQRSEFRQIDFQQVFGAAATLALQVPSDLRKLLLSRAKKSGDFLNGMRKSELAWDCAVLDSIFRTGEYRDIAEVTKKSMEGTAQTLARQKMRHDTEFWFQWNAVTRNPQGEERLALHSGDERHVRKVLESAGLNTESRMGVIPTFPQAIDFTTSFNNIPIQVEIDGPSHFLDRADGKDTAPIFNGKTRFRSACLRNAAPNERILRIPFNVTGMLTKSSRYSPECRKKIGRFLVCQTSRMDPDIYTVTLGQTDGAKCPINIVPMFAR